MNSFFVSCESIFRKYFSSSDNHSLQCYSDSVCNRSNVVSLFYTCTHFIHVHIFIVKSQEPVLMHIHPLGFLRCHANCIQLVEKYLYQNQSQRKQTAL